MKKVEQRAGNAPEILCLECGARKLRGSQNRADNRPEAPGPVPGYDPAQFKPRDFWVVDAEAGRAPGAETGFLHHARDFLVHVSVRIAEVLDGDAKTVFQRLFAGGYFFAGRVRWYAREAGVGERVRADLVAGSQPIPDLRLIHQTFRTDALREIPVVLPADSSRDDVLNGAESITAQQRHPEVKGVLVTVVEGKHDPPRFFREQFFFLKRRAAETVFFQLP